ncbi:mechanosensitive ion channel family protein, partial [Halorubrum sp. ASP121]
MYAVAVRGWFEGLSVPERNILVAVVVLFFGIAAGALAATLVRRLLVALGVDDAVEGTSFERTT